jgi:hypothetical protein
LQLLLLGLLGPLHVAVLLWGLHVQQQNVLPFEKNAEEALRLCQ